MSLDKTNSLATEAGLAEALNLNPPSVLAAYALSSKATTLGAAGKFEEALATADEYLCQYGKVQSFRKLTAVVLMGKCIGLISLLRFEEAGTLCDEILREYVEDTDLVVCQAVEKVRGYKLKAIEGEREIEAIIKNAMETFTNSLKGLLAAGTDEEVLAACDVVVLCYSDVVDPAMRLAAVYARLKKSTLLTRKGNPEAARRELTKLILQFQDDVDPRILELVNSTRKILAGEAG